MPDPLVITSSDIDSFLQCRRAWKWGHVDRFNLPEPEVGALALGSRVHAALLDGFYTDGRDPVAYHDVLARESLVRLEIADAPSWDIDKLFEDMIIGRNCVEAYMDWLAESGADHGLTVEGVEQKLEAPILDGKVILRGKVDLRFLSEDGSRHVSDLKTSGLQMTAVHHKLERSYQPVTYDWLLDLNSPGQHVSAATFRIIKKARRHTSGSPEVEEYRVPGALRARSVRRAQIERIAFEMLALVVKFAEPDGEILAYPHPADSCAWCDFKHPCLVADSDPDSARAMLTDLFTASPHARYDDKDAHD